MKISRVAQARTLHVSSAGPDAVSRLCGMTVRGKAVKSHLEFAVIRACGIRGGIRQPENLVRTAHERIPQVTRR